MTVKIKRNDIQQAEQVRSNVEVEIFSRSVRKSLVSVTKSVPENAKGYIYGINIYGITGTFDAGEGLRARIFSSYSVGNSLYSIETERVTSSGPYSHPLIISYPGSVIGDATNTTNVQASGLPVSANVVFRIDITGTFGEGEGFDCEGFVNWLF